MVTTTQHTNHASFADWQLDLPVHWSLAQREQVQRAYHQASESSLQAADLLISLGMDVDTVIAVLLYESAIHTPASLPLIEREFGASVARLIDGARQMQDLGLLSRSSTDLSGQLEIWRKLLLAMANDLRVVVMTLTIRLVQLRHLDGDPEPCRQLAQETLDLFAPLANRLGLGRLKWEMEDLALRQLQPEAYKKLAKALDERRSVREQYIARVIAQVRADLQQVGIDGQVTGRAKHIYSIWRKMQRKELPFERIFDVHAIRIIVNNVTECYTALGLVHAQWTPIPSEFDDYIAHPKENGYQSLHTAVIGPEGKTIEIQIRSRQMHDHAELGVAAHWRYKEGKSVDHDLDKQINWLRQLLDSKDTADGTDSDLLDRFKAEAFQDRVYVLTPKGQVIDLPQGATPLDFAYTIHTDLGHRCRGAKVNDRIVPLTHTLKNGDRVDILTAKEGAPSRDWLLSHLGYLKTTRALAKVRTWFRQQDHDKNVAAGKAALEEQFRRLNVHLKPTELQKLAEHFNFNKIDDLFASVGEGLTTVNQVLARTPRILPPPSPPVEAPVPARHGRAETATESTGESSQEALQDTDITIVGVGKLLTQLATCCKPMPYDPIVGFITRGRGVSVHRQDCLNVLELARQQPGRIVEVSWGEHRSNILYTVTIRLKAYDRKGLLRDVADVLTNEDINVVATDSQSQLHTGMASLTLTVQVRDVLQLSRALDRLAQIPNVVNVWRRV